MSGGVWVTRPARDAAETAARVAELGFAPVVAPLIEIENVPLDLPEPGDVRAVLAPSRNAVRALPAAWHGTPLLAVGDATAAEARSLGWRDVESADGDAADLAALALRSRDPGGPPILLATGMGQGEALAATLRAANFTVDHRAVYAARPVAALPAAAAAALRARGLVAALFFSAETARAAARLIGPAGLAGLVAGVRAVAIGEPARMALGAIPWRAVVAPRPTQDAMLAMLHDKGGL